MSPKQQAQANIAKFIESLKQFDELDSDYCASGVRWDSRQLAGEKGMPEYDTAHRERMRNMPPLYAEIAHLKFGGNRRGPRRVRMPGGPCGRPGIPLICIETGERFASVRAMAVDRGIKPRSAQSSISRGYKIDGLSYRRVAREAA
jgi:hypothetical protein